MRSTEMFKIERRPELQDLAVVGVDD